MSIRIMTSVWSNSNQSGSNLLVLLALSDNANDEGYCWPSITTLAKKTRMSTRNLGYVLKKLEESGEIKREPRPGRSNYFYITTPEAHFTPPLKPTSPITVIETPKKRKVTDAPKRDPLLDNEYVKAFRDVAHITPNEVQRKDISDAEINSIEEWRLSISHWIGHGWSKTNVTGMLSFLSNGGVAGCSLCNRNGHKNKQVSKPQAIPSPIQIEEMKLRLQEHKRATTNTR